MKVVKKVIISILLIIVATGTVAVGYFVSEGHDMYKVAIEKTSLEAKVTEIKSYPNYTKLEEIPQIYIDAVISVEDHRFKEHEGIDVISIGRAIFNDIKEMSFVEGGSTITQQLAKNIYFTQEKKMERKVAEVFMAFEIENNYSKNEILELYINTSFYGDNCYTLKEASRHYFGKEPMDMTDYESIMLAGVPNAPSVYAPTVNLELAKQRQRQVLSKMVKYEHLTQEEADKIVNK